MEKVTNAVTRKDKREDRQADRHKHTESDKQKSAIEINRQTNMLQTYQDLVPVGVVEWVTSANLKQLILCSVWVARVWRNERGYRKNNLDLVIDKVCDEVLLWSEEERVGKGREIESVEW